eukprot:g6842.t1
MSAVNVPSLNINNDESLPSILNNRCVFTPRTLIEQSEAQEENIRELFQTFDCDKNGRIDIDHMQSFHYTKMEAHLLPKPSNKGSKGKKGGKPSSPSRRGKPKQKKKLAAKSALLSKDSWIKVMQHSGFVGSKHFVGLSEYSCICIFLFSKSYVADDLLDKARYRNANEFDFLEAICRVANVLNLPSKRQLEKFSGTVEGFFRVTDLSDEEIVKRHSFIKNSLDKVQVYKGMDIFREFSKESMEKDSIQLAEKLEVFLPLFLCQLRVAGRDPFF